MSFLGKMVNYNVIYSHFHLLEYYTTMTKQIIATNKT